MRTVLITGGSRGIGREMVKTFCKAGYRVAFTYKSSHKAAKELSELTGAMAIAADCEREDEIYTAVKKVEEELGNVEILINNAAVSSFSMVGDITLDEWKRTFSVNVDAPFLYTKATIAGMVKNKCGRIINISSMWGEVGSSCEVHYSASKAALIGMTKALAKELGPSGICVNCVAPGVIDTEMNSHLSDEDMTALEEETPLCRIGKPEDVASCVEYLASDGASFVTGQVISPNGGIVI